MKTNWLIIMLLAGVAANAQVYIGSNLNKELTPGVALEIESDKMGIQFPVINLSSGETLDSVFLTSTNLPEGSMVYVNIAEDYQNSTSLAANQINYKTNGSGFYVKSSNTANTEVLSREQNATNLTWQFNGVIEEKFINNQVVNEFLGYQTHNYSSVSTAPIGAINLEQNHLGFKFNFCKTNTETNHSYCVFEDIDTNVANNTWDNAYKLAKEKGGYLLTITNQKEYNFVLSTVFNESTMKNSTYKTWMGFTTYIMNEFQDTSTYANKTDVTPTPTTNGLGNIKYLFITGEEYLMDWVNSTQKGAMVETSKYYDESTFLNDLGTGTIDNTKFKSAYFDYHTKNMNVDKTSTIKAAFNTTKDSNYKYVIVEFTN